MQGNKTNIKAYSENTVQPYVKRGVLSTTDADK